MQKKKVFSLILALALTVSAVCCPALATSPEDVALPIEDTVDIAEIFTPEKDILSALSTVYYNETWELFRFSNSTYGTVVKDTCATIAKTSGRVTTIESYCDTFETQATSSGQTAYVSYYLEVVTSSGDVETFNTKVHQQESGIHPGEYSIYTDLQYGSTFYGYYNTAGATTVDYGFSGRLVQG